MCACVYLFYDLVSMCVCEVLWFLGVHLWWSKHVVYFLPCSASIATSTTWGVLRSWRRSMARGLAIVDPQGRRYLPGTTLM